MVKKIQIKEKQAINLYFVGDIHAGSRTCDKKALIQTVNLIKRDKNARVVLMGDLGEYIFENDTRRYDADNMDSKLNDYEKQTAYIMKTFKPIKKKIYGILRGNHESAFAKYNKDEYADEEYRDECEYIAQKFKVPYLEELAIIELTIKKHIYQILATHGVGSGSSLGGQLNGLKKIGDIFEFTPDIIVMGHVHALQTIINPKLNFNFKTKVKHLALSGSYYRTYQEGSINYASSCLYSPLPIGCVMYKLGIKGEITDNKIIFET